MFKIITGLSIVFFSLLSCKNQNATVTSGSDTLIRVFDKSLRVGMLDVWYPLVIDSVDGGYFSNLSYDWKISGDQPKMLVSQSRHVWTCSEVSLFYNDTSYTKYARHGFDFLKKYMWDHQYGGFFNLRSKNGSYPDQSYRSEKRAYGNSFAIYGLASYYRLTSDTSALNLAKKTFLWLEKYSHDKLNGGYIDEMDQKGTWISKTKFDNTNSEYKVAPWKDYNSSIHLLESFTELYKIWPDTLVRTRLTEMLSLIRDTFITKKGYLTLYFTPDWKPVSNRDSSEHVIRENSYIDHVSFGHDVETAFLMLEASHALRLKDDTLTLHIARKLVDHSLTTGFDKKYGGFFYEGYYFKGRDSITILNTRKDWWVQAEGLNALLMMSKIFPGETKYYNAFIRQWDQIDKYVLDKEYGDWFISGLDYNPESKTAPKATIWKANYHNARALMNCINMLGDKNEVVKQFAELANKKVRLK